MVHFSTGAFAGPFERLFGITRLLARCGSQLRVKSSSEHEEKEWRTGMRDQGVFFPLVVATLLAGCVMTVLDDDFLQWIPILLAFAVVCGFPKSWDRW